jgi:hypothetical protein
LAPLFARVRYSNSTLITILGRSLITANTTVITTASTALIAPMDEVGIDKAVAAMIDVEALATAEEALVEDLVEVDSRIEPDIDKLRNSILIT